MQVRETKKLQLLLAMGLTVLMFAVAVLVATGESFAGHAAGTPRTFKGRVVTIIGDSLVENRGRTYVGAFAERGVWSVADGYSGRTLRWGWLCRVNGVRKVYPKPVGNKCGIEGLELLERMVRNGSLGGELVLALGTNDASVFPGERSVRNLNTVRSLIGTRRVWLVTAVRLKDRVRATAWNQTATKWCARDIACSVIPWASMKVAWDPKLYVSDGVHLLERGTRLRAEMIATAVAGP